MGYEVLYGGLQYMFSETASLNRVVTGGGGGLESWEFKEYDIHFPFLFLFYPSTSVEYYPIQ